MGSQREAATRAPGAGRRRWHYVRRYLATFAVSSLVWEFAQLPLYTLWQGGRPGEILYDVLHCTVGDVMIAASALAAGVLLAGRTGWPSQRRLAVGLVAILSGLAYTAFSEWLNVTVLKSWAYSSLMPLVPGTGIGMAPLVQWLVLPLVAFRLAERLAGAAVTTT